jgi:transcriptional regulator with XRE-family HTH domain
MAFLLVRFCNLIVIARSSNSRLVASACKPDFARYVRDARIKRGLSVIEVVEQVGISQASIHFWERDHCRPRDTNLSALFKVLRLPIREPPPDWHSWRGRRAAGMLPRPRYEVLHRLKQHVLLRLQIEAEFFEPAQNI